MKNEDEERADKPRIDPNNPRILEAKARLGVQADEDPLAYDPYERDEQGAAIRKKKDTLPSVELPRQRAEYVPPITVPPGLDSRHKTFEMQTVKVNENAVFPQKKVPTARRLDPVRPEGSALRHTPPGPPTAADQASMTSEAAIFKSPLANEPEQGPVNYLASASPWGAGAAAGSIDPRSLPSNYAPEQSSVTPAPVTTGKPAYPRNRLAVVAGLAVAAPLVIVFALYAGSDSSTTETSNATSTLVATTEPPPAPATAEPAPAPPPPTVEPPAAVTQTAAPAPVPQPPRSPPRPQAGSKPSKPGPAAAPPTAAPTPPPPATTATPGAPPRIF